MYQSVDLIPSLDEGHTKIVFVFYKTSGIFFLSKMLLCDVQIIGTRDLKIGT